MPPLFFFFFFLLFLLSSPLSSARRLARISSGVVPFLGPGDGAPAARPPSGGWGMLGVVVSASLAMCCRSAREISSLVQFENMAS